MSKKRRIRSTYPEAKAQKLKIKESAAAYGIDCEVVSVREAKDNLSSLLDRADAGARVVITSDGKPKAMLVRYKPVIMGAPWTSLKAFRDRFPMTADSTPMIREMRDRGY